ncbi:MAG: hypothetical protein AB7O63_09900 [Reyranellaceae bacterium]
MNSIWSRWGRNWVAAAATTLTASSADTARPAVNAASPHLALPWRALALSATLDVDCGQARDFDVFGLFGLRNLTAAATVRVTLSSVEAGGAELYDSGVVAMGIERGFDQWTLALEATIAARWLRFAIDDPDNADGHMDVGLAWAGAGFETTVNPDYGWAAGHDDPSPGQPTPGGQTYLDRRRLVRVVSGRYAHLDRDQARGAVLNLAREGGTRSCLLLPEPNGPLVGRQAICGLLQKSTRLTRDAVGRMGFDFEIRERL